MDARTTQQRAISRALAMGGATAVVRVRYGLYKVGSSSRPGTVRTVSVDGRGVYRCDCEAGLAGRPCWHQAAVYVAKIEAAGKGKARVSGPARPAPSSPAVPAAPLRRAA